MDRINVANPIVDEEEVEAVREVILSGYYAPGPKVDKFEKEFSDYIGTDYAAAVNGGTAALHVSLAAAGIGPGDEVIVPPMTFFATVAAVLHQNAIPVFADIEQDSFCIDPEDIKEKITSKTKAIIPVHLFGNAAEVDEINEIAEDNDLIVIEDAAQAHGTEYKGEKVGSIGDIGCFSFYATKHMTTGEGGIITTDDKEIAEKAQAIKGHGMTGRHEHSYLGYNYEMSEINAAMGLVQLEKLDRLNERRIENSEYLLDEIEDGFEWLQTPDIKPYVKHTYFWCPVVVNEDLVGMDTSKVIKLLDGMGVETRNRYTEPIYHQPVLENPYPNGCPYECQNVKPKYDELYLENAENLVGRFIGLPNHPGLEKEDLDKVLEVLKKFEGEYV
ncbi:MAG: DegT/DnrJ/EryC1/StrS family aminotransferase [Thermoplasmatota archaeon]